LSRRNTTLVAALKASKSDNAGKLLSAIEAMIAVARKIVGNDEAPVELRTAALPLLGRGAEKAADLDLLASLFAPQVPPAVQEAALATLGRLGDEQVPAMLLANWKGFAPARRVQVLDLLMSRGSWTMQLLAAVGGDVVSPAEFDALHRQRLLEPRQADARTRAREGLPPAANADRPKVLDQNRAALELAGDLARGAQLFAKSCAQCHKLAGTGYDVGPDLASLTDKSPEALLVAILDPNRAVETKFLSYVALTRAGMTESG